MEMGMEVVIGYARNRTVGENKRKANVGGKEPASLL